MWTNTKRFGVAALAGGVTLALALPQAHGQFFRPGAMPLSPSGVSPFTPAPAWVMPLQPLAREANGLTAAALMPGYSSPYLTGFPNPAVSYPNPAGGQGGGYPSNPYGQGMVDPTNPYTAALKAPSDRGSQYDPYNSDPYSGFLRGSADVIRAQGSLMMDQEKARLISELALQARLATRQMRLDTEYYLRENTETFTQEQARFAAKVLQRIQNEASVGEVESGKAMNVLLKALGERKGQKSAGSGTPVGEDVLRRINVTSPNGGNLGLLRDDAQLNWPTALVNLVPEKTRTDIENLTAGLFKLAVARQLQPRLVQDLGARVDAIQAALRAKVNDLPTGQYTEANRFLAELRSAVAALHQPDVAPAVADYQKFIRGGKTAPEVAEWLNRKGLVIAPATAGDEAAYHALYTALANYATAGNVGAAVANKY